MQQRQVYQALAAATTAASGAMCDTSAAFVGVACPPCAMQGPPARFYGCNSCCGSRLATGLGQESVSAPFWDCLRCVLVRETAAAAAASPLTSAVAAVAVAVAACSKWLVQGCDGAAACPSTTAQATATGFQHYMLFRVHQVVTCTL